MCYNTTMLKPITADTCDFEALRKDGVSFLLAAHGLRFRMEDVQADGRADVVAEHPCGVFIFELKVDEPAADALEQVKAKGYDAPYRGKGLPIYLIGLAFDSRTRHLADAAAVKV